MKKLLMLIGANVLMVTAITPVIVNSNTEIKNKNQQTNLSLNKSFSINGNDELVLIRHKDWLGGVQRDYELIFTPVTFEKMVNLYYGSGEDFKNFVFDNFDGADKNDWVLEQQLIHLWKNIKQYFHGSDGWISRYTQSNKNHRWRLSFSGFKDNCCWPSARFNSFNPVGNDTKVYPNEKIETLKRHFNGDLDHHIVSLGIIPNDGPWEIKDRLRALYPELQVNHFNIVKNESRSTTEGYLVKLQVDKQSFMYSIGDIANDFVYNTEDNMKKINDKFNNDSNVKMWIEHINEWDQNVKRQIKEDVPKLSEAQKRIWKDNVAEQMKTYIREWNIILRLIDIELKLEDLDNIIKDIKKDIETLKAQIRDINNKIADINNSGKDCTYYGYASDVASYIPVFGNIMSGVFNAFRTLCEVISE